MQGQNKLADVRLLRPLLALVEHPDDDIQERALLGLIALAQRRGPRQKIREAGGQKAAAAAEVRRQLLLRDADAQHRAMLEELGMLLEDLQELLSSSRDQPDRDEL